MGLAGLSESEEWSWLGFAEVRSGVGWVERKWEVELAALNESVE